jgi:thiol-disulfide isomerase/thioredoxin
MCSKRGMAGWDPGSGAVVAVVAAMILTGCGGQRQGDATGGGIPAPAAVPPATSGPLASPAPVKVRLVDHAGLMQEVERHRGKVVVLDCWSTSCPPCVKEFPGLVKLAAAHGDRVQCLSLCFDYDGLGKPDDLVPPVKAFLEKVGAGEVVNLLSSEEADSLYQKLDLVSVPAIFIWKPDGSLAVRYDDDMAARELRRPFTYADVQTTVARLVAD